MTDLLRGMQVLAHGKRAAGGLGNAAITGVLPPIETQPGIEIEAASEASLARCKSLDSKRGHRADGGHRLETARGVRGLCMLPGSLRARHDAGGLLGYLKQQVLAFVAEEFRLRRAGVLDYGLDGLEVTDALRSGMSELLEQPAGGVHEFRAQMDEAFAGAKQRGASCCSSDFGGTKRISGRCAAIKIASASAASAHAVFQMPAYRACSWNTFFARSTPIIDRIDPEVIAALVLHADDTPTRVLDRSRRDRCLTKGVKQGGIWAYVSDQRAWVGTAPPGMVCRFSPDRKDEHPWQHLQG